MSRERIVIEVGQSGLGDSLTFSSLPELYVRERNCEVYLRHANFRNNDIENLIWKPNPFLSGIVNEQGTIGGINWKDFAKLGLKYGNPIKTIEAYYGFEPRNSHPRLYNINYTFHHELSDKVLIDLGAVTMNYSKEFLENFINHLIDNLGLFLREKCFVVEHGLVNTGESTSREDVLVDIPRLKTKDIFDFANMIFSCDIFVGASSGSIPLASAIKNCGPFPRQIFSCMTNFQFNQKVWLWEGVFYFAGSNQYEEFWPV